MLTSICIIHVVKLDILSSALSFLLTEGAFDQAEEWVEIGASTRSSIKAQYEAAGIKLIVSLFGSTDAPTSSGADPVATANTMAAWVLQYGLDGVDVDYEVYKLFESVERFYLITFCRTSTLSTLAMAKQKPGLLHSLNSFALSSHRANIF